MKVARQNQYIFVTRGYNNKHINAIPNDTFPGLKSCKIKMRLLYLEGRQTFSFLCLGSNSDSAALNIIVNHP